MSRERFLLFTNECVGFGHLRRALALSRAVTEGDRDASALIVTGAPIELTHPLPPRVYTVKLPLLTRDEQGNQHPRRLGMALADVRAMRTSLALAAARSLAPAVAVVDKTPLGLGNELGPVLESLRATGARLVLGLRDIEDGARTGSPRLRPAGGSGRGRPPVRRDPRLTSRRRAPSPRPRRTSRTCSCRQEAAPTAWPSSRRSSRRSGSSRSRSRRSS